MNNNLNEINKLEEKILNTQKKLNKSTQDSDSVSIQRNIFLGLFLILLAAFIYSYFFKNKSASDRMIANKNLLLIDKDSLKIYRTSYLNSIIDLSKKDKNIDKTLAKEKIIYSVQIGAFKEFYLTSDSLMNLSEFQVDGYNKFSIGNYKTYAEAKNLKQKLIKLGFKDCFLSAKSFGKEINIIDALALSNEPEFLDQ